MITVRFLPQGRSAAVDRGTTILEAARAAGIEIAATCGGRGRCRSCRVRIVEGPPPPASMADRVQLGDEEVREGYRLACQAEAWEDMAVLAAPIFEESSFQILTATGDLRSAAGFVLDSGVRRDGFGPELLVGPGGVGEEGAGLYGMAVDVGTTTVVGYLLDMDSGAAAATVSALNPQSPFGGDLMSRIAYAREGQGNARRLRSLIVGSVNELIEEACRRAGIGPGRIHRVVIVGNTVMHHLLLGFDVSGLGVAPYEPSIRNEIRTTAGEAGLRLNSATPVLLPPIVAGFVGPDAVAMALSARLDEGGEARIAADLGTNGEVVLGRGGELAACSAPAGPALEGGQIRCGVRASSGAIDRVEIGQEVRWRTIGRTRPVGVCGSGIIDAVAGLLEAGLLDPTGRLSPDPPATVPDVLRRRIVLQDGGSPAFVLAAGDETASGREVVLTQSDIRQVQLAKAAIRGAITMLQRITETPDDLVATLMLSGGFGNYLSIEGAVRIGLIPDLPRDRMEYVGNAAGLGAQMALLSETERGRAARIASKIRHVSLATLPEFQEVYLESMVFPQGKA